VQLGICVEASVSVEGLFCALPTSGCKELVSGGRWLGGYGIRTYGALINSSKVVTVTTFAYFGGQIVGTNCVRPYNGQADTATFFART